jgi:hypothetical protein
MGTREERLVVIGIQAQRVRELVHSVRIGRPTSAALQIGDTSTAKPSAVGELLLREPRHKPEVP